MGEKICGPLLPEDSSLIDLSSKFGSFILHAAAAVDFPRFRRENALLMLSSVSSESECCVSRSGSFSKWNTGCNGLCGECGYGSGSGRRWSPNDGFCGKRLAKDDGDQVVDNNNNNYLGGGGGSGGGGSNDNDDDQQQQQQLVLKLENLGFPSCYNSGKIKPPMVVGSCNGLICLHDSERSDVSLWNPATGKFRILPRSLSIPIASGNLHQLFGFGFDDQAKDYKVVLLSVFNKRMLDFGTTDGPVAMECLCGVQVYSSSTDSWKLLKGITSLPGSPFPYPPPDSSSELFYLNGSCFFMAKLLYSSEEEEQSIPRPKNQDRFIISLDLTKEIITPIQLPNHHPCQHLYLSYLGKKIALFTKIFWYTGVYDVNDPRCSWEFFGIWVFNEHRSSSVDDESWTRVHNFGIKLGLPGERNIPRGISSDGVFALLETGIRGGGGGLGNKKKKKMKMKLYNLVSKEVKNNFLSCDRVLSKAYPYQPSLVSIIGEAAAAADDMVIGKAVAAETADDNRLEQTQTDEEVEPSENVLHYEEEEERGPLPTNLELRSHPLCLTPSLRAKMKIVSHSSFSSC